jgi:hypothetical protein
MLKQRDISSLIKLEGNPRIIKDRQFESLCKSIKDNPDYFEARPLILSNRTGELVIIAGNQRYEAAKHLNLKKVPTYLIEGLTEEREREIIIRDNVNNGEWDHDILANEWDIDELLEWGVQLPVFGDFSEKTKESDTDNLLDQLTIKLNYSETEYDIVKEQLSKIASTPEQAVWKLLGNE